MAKIHPSWWNLVLDGKLHHIERGKTPYGSIASLRSAIYREASERGLEAVTYCEPLSGRVFFRSWDRNTGEAPGSPRRELEQATPVPDCLRYQAPLQQVAGVRRPLSLASLKAWEMIEEHDPSALTMAQAEVLAAGLDPYDVDLVEERTYCTCGLGNATEDKRHDPSCQVWG